VFDAHSQRSTRVLRIVAVLAASVLLTACGCNTVGCGHDLRVDVPTLSQWIGHEFFTVEVCVDGSCDTVDVDAVAAAASLGGDIVPFAVVPEGASGDVAVEITVTAGTEVKHASGSVALESYRPNGRFCPPTCMGADITIDDGVVRNR